MNEQVNERMNEYMNDLCPANKQQNHAFDSSFCSSSPMLSQRLDTLLPYPDLVGCNKRQDKTRA